MRHTFLLLLLLAAGPLFAADRPDILVADFEGDTYGDWKTTGEAFGSGPAKGALPGQMGVSGYLGKGLVNSFHKGDASTGTLTSPEITVSRKHLNFLIGGGNHPGKTCINLLVGGKIVRTASGPNDSPGGSESLDWHTWDVSEFDGKAIVIQIVDDEKGGWGHINVDHIVQSDRKKAAAFATRDIAVTTRYLHLPVKNGGPKRRVQFEVDGKTVREFEIELAEGKADFLAFSDVSAFAGKTIHVSALLPNESKALDAIAASDDLPAKGDLYQEKLRPRFHFTSRRGWLNDPNGLVFDGTEWHLYYQHNPFGFEWGNMHWGHAVSTDLVHWKELGIGLYPKSFSDMAFSGSAVLDKANTSGVGTKASPPLALAYTSTGRGECMAFSTDKGRTWTEYEKNPVVKHAGRDPKLVWHAPTKRWVMAVYDEEGGKRRIAFHTSPDLKTWTFRSTIDDFFECPDLFEAPVDGDAKDTRWILYAADGKYLVGTFDGEKFTKESGKHTLWHGNFYAAQTYDNAPSGRRVQIGWASGVTFPGMPFNQQMNVPVELTLKKTADGIRMFAEPVKELDRLHGKMMALSATTAGTETKTIDLDADALDVRFEFEPGKADAGFIRVRDFEIKFDLKKKTLACGKLVVPLQLTEGSVKLRILVDRGSVEVFADGGATAISVAHIAAEKSRSVSAGGDGAKISLVVYPMKSSWK